MRRFYRFLIIGLLASLLLGALPTRVQALPPFPSSFLGQVSLNGLDIPVAVRIEALIDEKVVAYNHSFMHEGHSFYFLDVPGDDPSTAVIEGGKAGQEITFLIGGIEAEQTATWASATNVRLDLTASAPYTFTPPPTLTHTPTRMPTRTATPTRTPTQPALPNLAATSTPFVAAQQAQASLTANAQSLYPLGEPEAEAEQLDVQEASSMPTAYPGEAPTAQEADAQVYLPMAAEGLAVPTSTPEVVMVRRAETKSALEQTLPWLLVPLLILLVAGLFAWRMLSGKTIKKIKIGGEDE